MIPDKPSFRWKTSTFLNDSVAVIIQWLPNVQGHPGSHFKVKYRIENVEGNQKSNNDTSLDWQLSQDIYDKDFAIINDLLRNEQYEFVVISVDGKYETPSASVRISTATNGKPIKKPLMNNNETKYNWGTGILLLIVAIVLLSLLCVCIIKRNRGDKYYIHDNDSFSVREYTEEWNDHQEPVQS